MNTIRIERETMTVQYKNVPKVYLGGPMLSCPDSECKAWRDYVIEKLGAQHCLDPMRRDYRGHENDHAEQIVNDDKSDIRKSDIVLVNHTRVSAGTAMEMIYAELIGVPVWTVIEDQSVVSPWTIFHSNIIFKTLDEAIDALSDYLLDCEA